MKESVINARVDSSEVIRLLTCSDLRKNLILTLNNGSASLADLRQHTGVSSTAAIHALRELEKDHLTSQDDKRNYTLTNIGKILALKLECLVKAANVLAEHAPFWLDHDLSGIPETSLMDIGALEEAHLLTSTPTDVFKAFSTFVMLLENSRKIRGVSPIFTPDLIEIFIGLVAKGIPIELIVTREVLDKTLESSPRGPLQEALDANLKLFVIDHNPKTAFTVTDYFVTIGLYRFGESYDYSDELLCYSEEGITWGNTLFDYYLARSERCVLED